MASPASSRNTPCIRCWWDFRSDCGFLRWFATWCTLSGGTTIWQTVATYCVAGGIVGALLAVRLGLD